MANPLFQPTYNTPEELKDRVDEYITKQKEEAEPCTMAGLSVFLGYASPRSLSDVRDRKDGNYGLVLDYAKSRIEDEKNRKMLKNQYNVAGAIFDLKNNHGWTDKQEITGRDGQPLFTFVSNINRDEGNEA